MSFFNNWKPEKFDHEKTKFSLLGAHSKLVCNQCHRLITVEANTFVKYKLEDFKCASCHFIIFAAIILTLDIFGQSPHGDLKGMDCVDCHESTNWKIDPSNNKYDHAKTALYYQANIKLLIVPHVI